MVRVQTYFQRAIKIANSVDYTLQRNGITPFQQLVHLDKPTLAVLTKQVKLEFLSKNAVIFNKVFILPVENNVTKWLISNEVCNCHDSEEL